MTDERPVVREEFDGDDIEPAGRVVQKILMFGQISLGDAPDLSALGLMDGFFGKAEGRVGPGFHLDKNKRRPVVGDDVDFPPEESVAAFDDAEPFSGEVADSRLFAAAA